MQLLQRLEALVKEERKVQYQILQGLVEVDRSLFHLQVGCKDIYEFCMKKLGYSEGAACRRVNAMRLMCGGLDTR